MAKKVLIIHCQKHPRYRADRKSKSNCRSCDLLYVLRHQYREDPDGRLGSLNPYTYFLGFSEADFEDACEGLKVTLWKRDGRKGKTYRKIDAKEIAKALGAEIITDPEERKEFEQKYGLPYPLVPKCKK